MSKMRRHIQHVVLAGASAFLAGCDSPESEVVPPTAHHINLGLVEPGETITKQIDLTQDGSMIRPVVSVTTTCGCVSAQMFDEAAQAHVVELTITAPAIRGEFQEQVTLISADEGHTPAYLLTVSGEVEPTIMWTWGIPGTPLRLTKDDLPWEQSLPLRIGSRVSGEDVNVHLVSAGPQDRLQLTDDRYLAGGTRVVLRIPEEAPCGRWKGDVVFELDSGDGERPTRHTLPVEMEILCDQSPAPRELFFGRMSAGEVKSIHVAWSAGPAMMAACDLPEARWTASDEGGALTLTMPSDMQGDSLRGSIEVSDASGTQWVLPVLALHVASSDLMPLLDRISTRLESGHSTEAIAAALNQTSDDVWLPPDDPLMLSETAIVEAIEESGSHTQQLLLDRGEQVMAFFRLMIAAKPIPASHAEAIDAFIGSLPPPGQRSLFVQAIVDAMERKLTELRSS